MNYRPLGSRYQLEDQIGQGGMGVVWRGRDRVTGDVCAIKVLRPELTADPGAVTRFVRERTALVKFRHPNVVTLRDMIVEGDSLALVMDFIDGGDLGTYRHGCGAQRHHVDRGGAVLHPGSGPHDGGGLLLAGGRRERLLHRRQRPGC
jgi:serine/threonine protein kinase